MKKIIVTSSIIISSFMLTNSLTASPQFKGSNARETVRREITRNITCPDFITENSVINEVKAIVSVNEAGKVSIVEINSANQQLQEYVLDRLGSMKIKNNDSIADKFVLVIKFAVD